MQASIFAETTSPSEKEGSHVSEEYAIKLKLLREENVKLTNLNAQRQDIESQLVDSKIKSANLDLENDQLACKLQAKNEQIKVFSERITALEIDLLKSK